MSAVFSKLLIANRGEIAVRVMRSCRELGISTVAVHSDADAGALHVRTADQAVSLGGVTAGESYLDIDKVVAAIRATGAEAVHPGYGFLSENASFATAVEAADAVFVGPPAGAMVTMGSKLSAREAALAANVPTVPGSAGPVRTGQAVRDFAAAHGYPVAVKASYGGGGRGMRVVRSDAEADAAIDAAQREAQAYFGHPEVYVERYLDRPRHVEVQILADTYGSVVALGTRDCSVQRRHQKLIEEAPATVVSAATAAAMEAASCALAASVDYRGAGTLEFLVQDDEFYFLEMNTRLQVEHPVTEAVTGIDLVAEQLRIAAGLPISFKQEDVQIVGHAIELRINAEDAHNGDFLPTPGEITSLIVPQRPGVRFDGGYEPGDRVSEHYDGLIGKLVVWADDRPSAIAQSRRALRDFHVAGIKTTAPGHAVILAQTDFVEDRHTTRWLETDPVVADGLGALADDDVLAGVTPRRLAAVSGRRYWIPHAAGGQPPLVALQKEPAGVQHAVSDGFIRAPMQGVVVKLAVEVGHPVDATDVVCVLEAMKMESPLRAGRSGRVVDVLVSEGHGVAPGEVLLKIE